MLFANFVENLINSMAGAISLCIAVLGIIALAWFLINSKSKILSTIITFFLIAILSYLAKNPELVPEIGEKVIFKIMEGFN